MSATPYSKVRRAPPDRARLKVLYIDVHPEYQIFKNVTRSLGIEDLVDVGHLLVFAVDSVLENNKYSLWDLRHFCDFIYEELEHLEEQLAPTTTTDKLTSKIMEIESELMMAYQSTLEGLVPRLETLATTLPRNTDGDVQWLGTHFQYPHVLVSDYDR